MLAVDLLVGDRTRGLGMRAAAVWSSVWVLAGVAFGLLVIPRYVDGGPDAVTTWFTAYTIEKSLSIDNVFLWLLVFATFSVPRALQRRVLLIGVLSAIVLRSAMIVTATSIIESAGWVLYVAGAFLIVGAVKLWREGTRRTARSRTRSCSASCSASSRRPTGSAASASSCAREGGCSPLPCCSSSSSSRRPTSCSRSMRCRRRSRITTDPVMIITAHTFALLGLRSLFWLVSGVIAGLSWMKRVVAVILAWIGVTIIAEHALASYPLSTVHSLVVIVGIITFGFLRDRNGRRATRDVDRRDEEVDA
jgi:tellurite resistance protein TerC